MSETDDRELTMHYMDKVHIALVETGRSINRSIVILVILCLIVIALSSELVTVDQQLSLGGVRLNVSLSIVLIGGAWAIGILFIYVFGLVSHEIVLRDIIIRLYKSLGYSDESLSNLEANPLEFPNILTVPFDTSRFPSDILGRISYIASAIVAFTFLLLGPILAQIVAGYKVVLLFGAAWWTWSSFLLLVIITVGSLISFFREGEASDRQPD